MIIVKHACDASYDKKYHHIVKLIIPQPESMSAMVWLNFPINVCTKKNLLRPLYLPYTTFYKNILPRYLLCTY